MRKLTALTLAMIVTAVLGGAAQADDIIVDLNGGSNYLPWLIISAIS